MNFSKVIEYELTSGLQKPSPGSEESPLNVRTWLLPSLRIKQIPDRVQCSFILCSTKYFFGNDLNIETKSIFFSDLHDSITLYHHLKEKKKQVNRLQAMGTYCPHKPPAAVFQSLKSLEQLSPALAVWLALLPFYLPSKCVKPEDQWRQLVHAVVYTKFWP